MPRGLDMSLDELIAKRKKPGEYHGYFRGRGRGRGRGYGPGPTRRLMNRNTVRTAPYSAQPIMQVVRTTVEQEMVVSGGTDTEEGTKLYLSNLDYDVSNSDIELLFSEIGHVKRHTVHYDRSGRSKGTAEVIFVHHSDALAAIERYNNVQLDGKPMKIELVGVNPVAPISAPPSTRSIPGKPNFVFQSGRGRAGARGLFHGRGAGGFRLARGGGQVKKPSGKVKKPREKVTAEDLDADLENYRLKAMQI